MGSWVNLQGLGFKSRVQGLGFRDKETLIFGLGFQVLGREKNCSGFQVRVLGFEFRIL
jgi:hypothetical protein